VLLLVCTAVIILMNMDAQDSITACFTENTRCDVWLNKKKKFQVSLLNPYNVNSVRSWQIGMVFLQVSCKNKKAPVDFELVYNRCNCQLHLVGLLLLLL
jgi:hypothetical protein